MKRILTISFSIILLLTSSSNVFAISQNQRNLYSQGVLYYNYDGGVGCNNQLTDYIGTGPANGLTFPDVTSVSDLVNNINQYIYNTRPNSPFVNMGAKFVAAGQAYEVNPALVVALAYKEEGLGTADTYSNNVSHDSFGVTGIAGFSNDKYGFVVFDSFEASIDPVTKYVSDGYVKSSGTYYSTSVHQMMTHYTPDGIDAATQITLDVMNKILDPIVSNANSSVDQTLSDIQSACGTSNQSSQNGASGVSYNDSANGFSLTGSSAMAHYYQCDPKWANSPYGAWSICNNGCGITSVTMVVDTLKNLNLTPDYYANRYAAYDTAQGSSWSLFPKVAADYGLHETDLGVSLSSAADYIRSGGLVIISVGHGAFTSGGHLMVIRAIDSSGKFYLANPGDTNNQSHTETTGYSASYLINQGALYHLWGFKK